MTPTSSATGRHNGLSVPLPAESLPLPPHAPHTPQPPLTRLPPAAWLITLPDLPRPVPRPAPQDPPIYRALLRSWAEHGRTLPGRHDPEWARLAAPPHGAGAFTSAPARPATGLPPLSGTRDPRGDGR